MKTKIMTKDLVIDFRRDILSCYQTNRLVFDSQNPYEITDTNEAVEFVMSFLDAKDSFVTGIFDDNEQFLYGIVIYDNVRWCNKSIAQIHIVNDKSIFGKKVKGLYEEMIELTPFDTLYAEIPSIAVHAIAMCKRLGFKKTGYIPNALPYVNSQGEERMYDLQIWVKEKEVK
jgi:hypothetical protein